jgi:uncharacterized protein YndB with AHSA1/START domain
MNNLPMKPRDAPAAADESVAGEEDPGASIDLAVPAGGAPQTNPGDDAPAGTGHGAAAALGDTRAPQPSGAPMEPIDSRSDRRHKLIAAPPAAVFAALSDPVRVARWWGPAQFTNTIHTFEFAPGGRWLLTMHGPDGTDYPNESRFTRIVADRLFEIEHLNGHHFVLTLELLPHADGTELRWRQTFDTAEHYQRLAGFVATANEQNLERLAAEVLRDGSTRAGSSAPPP